MDTRELNGKYIGKVIDAGLGESSGGKEQAVLLCQLGGDGPEKGVRLNYFGSFHENSVDHTIKALRTAGFTGSDLTVLVIDPETGSSGWKKAVPNPPDVEFAIEPEPEYDPATKAAKVDDQGNVVMRARVKWINAAGRLGVKTALSPGKAAAFAAEMKGKLLAFDQTSGAPKTNGSPPAAKPSPPKGPAQDPGDVPF